MTVAAVASVAVFAIVATKLVDFARNAFDPKQKAPKWSWNLLALGIGLVVAFVWELNLAPAANRSQLLGGQALTGLAIGAAASGWHELFDALSGVGKRARRT